MTNRSRVSRGVPTGGQFETERKKVNVSAISQATDKEVFNEASVRACLNTFEWAAEDCGAKADTTYGGGQVMYRVGGENSEYEFSTYMSEDGEHVNAYIHYMLPGDICDHEYNRGLYTIDVGDPEAAKDLMEKCLLEAHTDGRNSSDDRDYDWRRCGFYTPEESLQWDVFGFTPQESFNWNNNGFYSAEDARDWSNSGFEPEEASAWKGKGFYSAEDARDWSNSGFEPEEAAEWDGMQMSLPNATAWKQSGFTPESAERWMWYFLTPEEAKEWNDNGFDSYDADVAVAWRCAGNTAAEARKMRECGKSVTDCETDVFTEQPVNNYASCHYEWEAAHIPENVARTWIVYQFSVNAALVYRQFGIGPVEAAVLRSKANEGELDG